MALEGVVKRFAWNLGYLKYRFPFRSPCFSTSLVCSSCKTMIKAPRRVAYFREEEDGKYFSVNVVVTHEPLNIQQNVVVFKPMEASLKDLLTRINLKIFTKLEKKNKGKVKIPEITSLLYRDGVMMKPDFQCCEIFQSKSTFSLNIQGDSYSIVCNAPWIKSIALPKRITSRMVLFPRKLETYCMVKDKSSFEWFRSVKLAVSIKTQAAAIKDWEKVGDNYFYNVSEDDVGHYIKFVCTPKNETLTGPEFTHVAFNPVESSINEYHFYKTHSLTKEKVGDDKIRIVTYNILAHMYTNTNEGKMIFEYCAPQVLDKDQRLASISSEVLGYNADLICFQEVEASAFMECLLPQFENANFYGLYSPKGTDREGTACFYNRNKFALISAENFVYGEEVSKNKSLIDVLDYINQNDDFATKFKNLPHNVQLTILKSRPKEKQLIVVGNVHLYSMPEASLIRLLQAVCSLYLFKGVKNQLMEMLPDHKISFILCGDFNSTPDQSINQLVLSGSVNAKDEVWSTDGMKEFCSMVCSMPVKMDSAFKDAKFTNYTKVFKGCLDYIYYEANAFELSRIFPLPDEDLLSAHVGLPSIYFPSDHVPLIAELKWK